MRLNCSLEKLYFEINNLIETIDFDAIWKGFKPLKFALYTEKECYFDGNYIEKSDKFLGNTSINYNGEIIAIWCVLEDINPIVLASKMVHEMFHGYQMSNNETRFPDEMDAIYNYQYLNSNLSIKLRENQLINELVKDFNISKFYELLKLRKYRYKNYNYEFVYEAKIEQIEGSANYVELSVLKQLSNDEYLEKLNEMKSNIICPKSLFPIRIISYDIGALLLHILKENNIKFNEDFDDLTITENLISDIEEATILPSFTLENDIEKYLNTSKIIVEKALLENDIVFEGNELLLGFNVYNARYYNNYIISTYFVMFGNKINPTILYGNFVIETQKQGFINKIYRFK